ncbi:hypothetical protein E2C01_076530 [Portunus trituberculatus]|uniref:Uncharacterized protein n=1 Tax=Portunus trituberculatus TaxID=210409 RepID=A0A5B7IDF8_PORTR|nr:hypothetical protein [Portunus trituberculatus]
MEKKNKDEGKTTERRKSRGNVTGVGGMELRRRTGRKDCRRAEEETWRRREEGEQEWRQGGGRAGEEIGEKGLGEGGTGGEKQERRERERDHRPKQSSAVRVVARGCGVLCGG